MVAAFAPNNLAVAALVCSKCDSSAFITLQGHTEIDGSDEYDYDPSGDTLNLIPDGTEEMVRGASQQNQPFQPLHPMVST